MTEISGLIDCQAQRFGEIVETWKSLIDEGRETISMSDTNFHSTLLLEEDSVPMGEIKYRPISNQFHSQILPREVTILNTKPTHVSPAGIKSTIDHS